ncbi:Sua5/YciO/YrdC/YwlC family protein [Streptosporangium canum]|uniref:Sua5/YciO/YrdC/YwlC family protein n=1 Tax=Streptosporangium canum TaxID=324952 RepID=UPI0033A8ACD2
MRRLDSGHHFTLVCEDFAQLGQFVHVSNALFRSTKAATPGSCPFIQPATGEVPRRLLHPRKKTVGVRIPDSARRTEAERRHARRLARRPVLGAAQPQRLARRPRPRLLRRRQGDGAPSHLSAGHRGR